MPGTLPHSDEAERALLGSIFQEPHRAFEVAGLPASAFYSTRHQVIFNAFAQTVAKYGTADPVLTCRTLIDANQIDAAGGAAYLLELKDGAWTGANIAHYARIVQEKAGRRTIIQEADRLAHIAGNSCSVEDLTQAIADTKRILDASTPGGPNLATAIELSRIDPTWVEYAVHDFMRRYGVTLIYGPAGVAKTLLALRMTTEMLSASGGDAFKGAQKLFGHPDLAIRRRWKRVLYVSAEETGGALRARWDMVLEGMQLTSDDIRGEILFVWPFGERANFTVDRLEELLDSIGGEFDVVILDSWTSLVPSTFEGRLIEWERDTFATRRLVNVLRDLATRRNLNIIIVHHEGLEKGRGRGNTELNRNAPDTILALEKLPERRVKVRIAKQRDGRDDWSFVLALDFSGGAFRVRPEEQAERKLSVAQREVLMFLRAKGTASVAEIAKGTKKARTTVQNSLKALEKDGEAFSTLEKDENGSPIWSVPEGAHEVPGDE